MSATAEVIPEVKTEAVSAPVIVAKEEKKKQKPAEKVALNDVATGSLTMSD